MAANTSGSLKAWIESQGLALSAYRDKAPPDAAYPHVTIFEGIGLTVDQSGDLGDEAAHTTAAEVVQVNLWQLRRVPNGSGGTASGEQVGLADRLLRVLRAARLVPAGTAQVYGLTGLSLVRLDDPDPNVVHHAVTATIRRAV